LIIFTDITLLIIIISEMLKEIGRHKGSFGDKSVEKWIKLGNQKHK